MQVLAQDLPSVSPSRARALRECFMRVAFAQASSAAGDRSDAQLVGDAAHETLASLIEPGAPFEERLETVGEDFLAALERAAGKRPVRRSRAAAARLRKVAARAVALVAEAGEPVEVLCEQHLTSHDGRLNGTIDLVLSSASLHAIIDYKTGAVLDEDGAIATHLRDQLALYCVLEHERSGRWPDRALLVRFGGAAVDWAVDETVSRQTALDALDLRQQYLEHTGETPPASPSAAVCRHCAFAPRCGAFWDVVSPEWNNQVLAVRGIVVWSERTAAGGITIRLRDAEGSRSGDAIVQQLASDLPEEFVAPGTRIAVVGLRMDRDGQLNGGPNTRTWVRI